MSENQKNKKKFEVQQAVHRVVPIILFTAAALIAVSLIFNGSGTLGAGINGLLKGMFSFGAYAIPLVLCLHGVCYTDDLETKKIGKRAAFSTTIVLSVSAIDFALFQFSEEIAFAPIVRFSEMNGGGFIGSIIGFIFASLVGRIGLIILCIAVIAIFATFFYAEKAGAVGKAAINISTTIKKVIGDVKAKNIEANNKKKQIKAEEEQQRRELVSQELIDDEFFTPKGGSSDVKIKQLGIDEAVKPDGTSAIIDPNKRVYEPEEAVQPEAKPERRRRNADKPLDLSYGLTDEETKASAVTEEKCEDKPKFDNAFFGLDDSADSVFTRDFDPFDFATSEKISAKQASRVSVIAPTVQEELDEFAIYEMKANHVPTEREKKMAELERRKAEWMSRRQAQKSATEATASTATVEADNRPTVAETPDVVASASVTEHAPAASIPTTSPSIPMADTPPAPNTHNGTYSGYRSTKTTYSQPIKTVEFTITKEPSISQTESSPTPTVEKKSAPIPEATEDVAILISEKIARSNPAYARSANDLKTYTTVVSSGDDDLFRQLQGLDESNEKVDGTNNAPVTEAPIFDAEQTFDETDSVVHTNDTVLSETQPVGNNQPVTVEFEEDDSSNESLPPKTENHTQAMYQRAAGFASAMVNRNDTNGAPKSEASVEVANSGYQQTTAEPTVPTSDIQPAISDSPVIKPFSTPSLSRNIPTVDNSQQAETTIKVERSMLSPTPTSSAAPATNNTPSSVASSHTEPSVVSEPLFSVVEEDEPVIHSNPTVQTTPTDVQKNRGVVSFEVDEDENIPALTAEEIAEEEDVEIKEIPPEEQNPDVIAMRDMFPFLKVAPLNNAQSDSTAEQTQPTQQVQQANKVQSQACAPMSETDHIEVSVDEPTVVKSDKKAKKNAPATAEEDVDDVPFDDPVVVKKPVSTGLVPVEETKPQKASKPDYSSFELPPLSLLTKEENSEDSSTEEINENAEKLIETLASFNVSAAIKGVDRGPRITRYEVVPAKGVKVSQIMNLQDDIALNLAAGAIRMEAPIPGKSAVGIEIPNKKASIVRLRDLLETPAFETSKSKTSVCIGCDVAGQPVYGDIAKMPHLLIAGATGMGKSVCINALLISVLYKARPDEVKLIMIDPKQVEFTMYNGIPHLLVPVVSDPKQAAGALMWAVEEMERRYNMLYPLCVRNIDAYNEKIAAHPELGEPMPRIIIVIDEFADLMLQVKDPVETLVMRIAQKARAAGIYLVIGTQRPSVNVITGVIKANVPSRISCKVMSNVDSKTVLDSAGAEKLLDKGDALYAPAGSPKPHRVQCAFVSDSEVEAVMEYLRKFSNGEGYDSTVMEEIDRAAQKCSKKGGGNSNDREDDGGDVSGEGFLNDRQFLDAVEVAVNTRKISTSLIQRKLSIGYGKAAKFIDIMEDMGIVGEANGQRPREVLMTPDEWREKLARASYD